MRPYQHGESSSRHYFSHHKEIVLFFSVTQLLSGAKSGSTLRQNRDDSTLSSSSFYLPAQPLRIEALSCYRGYLPLFRNLSFSVNLGCAIQISGPNGCGKTTLLRTICGLRPPESGKIFWGDTNISMLNDDFKASMAYLGHLPGLKSELNATENLFYSAQLGLYSSNDLRQEISQSLKHFGLDRREHLPCGELSAGQKQRVALVRLILSKAPLWILDEPATSLDTQGIDLLTETMNQHMANGGMILYVSHQKFDLKPQQIQQIDLQDFNDSV